MPPKRKARSTSTRGRGAKGKASKRQKKAYSDDDASLSETDDAEEFDKASLQRTVKYDFNDLMNDPSLQHPEFVHHINPEDLNKDYWMETGLEHPLLFKCDPKLIGMKVPDPSFSVQDVLDLVGGNRIIEVVEVSNQGSVKMSLQDFVNFYNTPAKQRTTLYNVLSLEFSLTPLEDLVKSPALVREIDWVGTKWPDALRQRWIAFNGRDKKQYTPHHTFPKVQNYCLMSVADCYTDFHIDFSGTSVWYHVLKGKKVFWLIPPTETNFMLYQEFIQTIGDSSFFGKSVEKCHVAVLEPGDTMLIPSGWIHAVYTPEDSLVFGGNFLHSLSCKTQIRVYQCENRLNITRKFRLPYNEELAFYVIADYVKKWTGREYARPIRISEAKMDYVGQRWIDAGGHLKKIEYADFQNGVELDNEMIGAEEQSETVDRNEVKVIAMHAENTLYNRPAFKPSAADGLLDAEEVEDEEAQELEREALEKKTDEEIDEICRANPLIFYKNSKHDFVRNKCVPDHKLPVGHEPSIDFIQKELNKITPRLLSELEALGQYFKRKVKVEVAEGICQPASLLNAFLMVLKRRKMQLEGKKLEGKKEAPKRKYTRHAVESGKFDSFMQPVPDFKMEEFPEDFLEEDEPTPALPPQPVSCALEYVPSMKKERVSYEETYGLEEEEDEKAGSSRSSRSRENTPGVTRRSSRRAADKANNAIKEEIKEMEKPVDEEQGEGVAKKEEDEANEEEPEELSWRERMEQEAKARGSNRSSETKEEVGEDGKKRKMSREEKKALKAKEREKKRKSEVLDVALNTAHGNSKTKKKKPEKPQYVGGLPVAPIQNDPVVANPYNYDPKMEMVKLGTGQLKSAYRKTKNNVELRIEKNLYKLEPRKNSQDETEHENEEMDESAETSHHDESKEEITPEKPAAKVRNHSSADPISIDIFDIPSSSSKKKHHGEKSKGHHHHHHHHHHRHSDSHSQSPADPSPKSKLASPAIFSPSSNNSEMGTPKHTPKERKRSDSISMSAAKQAVYLPAVSRQDRMIAEAAQNASPTPRHSSFSERRPNVLPQTPQSGSVSASRSSSIDTPYTPYTPSAPAKSSWLPSGPSSLRNDSFDGSPIDVVSSEPIPSPHTPADSINSPGLLREITSPPGLLAYNHRESMNGSGRDYRNSSRRSSDASYSGARKNDKIPASKAIANLHVLVNQLKQLNET